MSEVQANDVQLNCYKIGSSGPALVMLHGLLVGNAATWYFTAAPTLAQKRQVFVYDLRGHGRSQVPDSGYDVMTMTTDLTAIVNHTGADRIALVGHSYGALVALRFALEFPERVSQLALVEAPLPPGSFSEVRDFLQLQPAEMVTSLPTSLQADVGRGGRRARRMIKSLGHLTGNTTVLRDLMNETDIDDDELSTIGCPVLCVYGEESQCRPVGDRLARVIPNCTHRVLPGGHYLPVESAGELTECLQEFFNA